LAVIREAGPADAAAVEAFLLRHVDGAMFPLSNLRNHGLGLGDFATRHPHAMRLWWVGSGVVGLTRQGMLMPMMPDGGDLGGLAARMVGLTVTGAVGPAGQVRAVLVALGLADSPTLRDADEPGFALDLAKLQLPVRAGARLIAPGSDARDLLIGWRMAYQIETLGTCDPQVQAEVDVDGYLARDSHRVLVLDGEPVAMTGFNAVLPEIVQIGGVFTPPALRNRGFARLAVALHLDEARQGGVRRAVLFAASAAAARAYAAVGFQPADPVGLVLFDGVQRVAQ
jgi:GNAT superfamily N-acetyltransferase